MVLVKAAERQLQRGGGPRGGRASVRRGHGHTEHGAAQRGAAGHAPGLPTALRLRRSGRSARGPPPPAATPGPWSVPAHPAALSRASSMLPQAAGDAPAVLTEQRRPPRPCRPLTTSSREVSVHAHRARARRDGEPVPQSLAPVCKHGPLCLLSIFCYFNAFLLTDMSCGKEYCLN